MTCFRTTQERVRLAIIGTGWWSGVWLDELSRTDLVDVVAIVGRSSQRAHAAAHRSGDRVLATDGLGDAVARAGANAALVVTPPHARAAVIHEALRLGVPVLVEKPFTSDLPTALALTRHAESVGELLMVSQSRTFDARLRSMRGWLDGSGATPAILSQLFFLQGGSSADPRGFRHAMSHPLAWDMAVHHFDAVRYVLGRDARRVCAMSSNPPWSWFDGDTLLSASFDLDDGVTYSYTGIWTDLGTGTSSNAEWRLSTSAGTLRWDGEREPAVESGRSVHRVPVADDPASTGLVGAMSAFVSALRSGAPPWGIARENLNTLAMVHAAVESARTARTVDIGELIARAADGIDMHSPHT